jgi:Raf kinase inhibitor-like YbhB/YbcL family protein
MQINRYIAFSACLALSLSSVAFGDDDAREGKFTLTSSEFKRGDTLPISAIYNYTVAGSNYCSINGATGGDKSPELSWTHAPRDTSSFVVTLFDTTAGVTHWGMYNISPETARLPQNAGDADSSYGLEVLNTFSDLSYDGPCPPAYYPPNNHIYIFTVWALSQQLVLPSSSNFPPTALDLYRALAEVGSAGHILATASLTSYYSTTPTPGH